MSGPSLDGRLRRFFQSFDETFLGALESIGSRSQLRPAWRRVRSVARKELRQLMRDRLTMGFVVGVPAAQLLLFGYAINQDVRHVETGVVDHSTNTIRLPGAHRGAGRPPRPST